MTEPADAQLRARRRASIEAALARYPHLSPEGLAELTDYFAREASSLDVGLIACNEEIPRNTGSFARPTSNCSACATGCARRCSWP